MRAIGITDVGITRTNNEDFFMICNEKHLVIVADGMGGYSAGEVASEIATTTIMASIEAQMAKSTWAFESDIEGALKEANEAILNFVKAHKNCRGMGTTVVVVYVNGDEIHVANVGDSRCYAISKDEIIQLTKDHSLVAELVKIGSISAEEAEQHPDKNIITSALGVEQHYEVFKAKYGIKKEKYLLVCSDGLTNMVPSNEILKVFNEESFETIPEKLVAMANQNGGKDNITVVCIEI